MPGAYSNEEYIMMVFFYGRADGYARLASREYAERYPDRRHPSHITIQRTFQTYWETGAAPRLAGSGVDENGFEEDVLAAVRAEPTTSICRLANNFGVPYSKVQRLLAGEGLHAYHETAVQVINEEVDGPLRVNFCQWLLQFVHVIPFIIFTDESLFTRDGVNNQHNRHHWASENPHRTRVVWFQHRFTVNVWAGIFGNHFIGPHIFEGILDGATYQQFIQEQLPQLLRQAGLDEEEFWWFQHDGAPPHSTRAVVNTLDEMFPHGWIGIGGTVRWPPRSPDLTPMDFYLWGSWKEKVYAGDPPRTREELVGRIVHEGDIIREEIERSTWMDDLVRRARLCIQAGESHFEHLL